MDGCDVRWTCLAWVLLAVTHRLVVVQVKESPDVPAGWYCLPDLAEPRLSTVKNESRLHVNHSKDLASGTLRSVPTATLRQHLPGLFPAGPHKKYHSTTTFIPLVTMGQLLATMHGTKGQWKEVWEAAVATAGDGVQTDRFGFHTMLQCKATRSAFRVEMNEPGFVSDVWVCVSVPWGSARVAVHLTPRLPLVPAVSFVFLKMILWIHLSSPRLSVCVRCGCPCVPSCPHFLRTYALARQLRLRNLRQLSQRARARGTLRLPCLAWLGRGWVPSRSSPHWHACRAALRRRWCAAGAMLHGTAIQRAKGATGWRCTARSVKLAPLLHRPQVRPSVVGMMHTARCLWLIDGPLPCGCTE